jgi:hypothetical protein
MQDSSTFITDTLKDIKTKGREITQQIKKIWID